MLSIDTKNIQPRIIFLHKYAGEEKSLHLKAFLAGNIESYLRNSGLNFKHIIYRTPNTRPKKLINNLRTANEATTYNIYSSACHYWHISNDITEQMNIFLHSIIKIGLNLEVSSSLLM